jgi:serine/threonine protein kinase
MDRPQSLGNLKTDEWKRLMEVIDRFEQAWIGASNPAETVDLRTYLPTPTDSLRPAALKELVKTDLEIRWRGNRGVKLDFYFERCPELGDAASLDPDLLYEEYRVRQLYGDRPPLASYEARFPAQFAALQQLVHDQPLPTRSKFADGAAAPAPASPAPKEPEPPHRILSVGGGYELTKYIGGGGFGKVWRARAPGGVEVAIKLIDRSLEQNEAHRELQALELTKQLRHPFLVQTHSYYALPDQIIIDMELCDCSLRDRLRACRNENRKGIPPKELLGYFREAAEAFDFLHTQNLQHRDVKPDNILLQQGHAKVADFGLARLQVLEKSIVDSGSGTPPYTAPEVWLGHIKPGSDSDQYSLACTYAELRLDRRLYQGTGMVELMMAHVEGQPDLSPLPQPEQQALLRALAKDPAKRYPSCKEFVSALEAALAKELGLSHAEQTFAEHRAGPASELTGEKTDPNSILPSIGLPTISGRSPQIAKWRQSAPEKPAPTADRTPPDWKPGKKPEKLKGKARLFKSIAMFLVLVIAGIALYGLLNRRKTKLEDVIIPENCEKADDAVAREIGGKKYYDRIHFVKAPVEFVLVPPCAECPNPFYIMTDKTSVELFSIYDKIAKPHYRDDRWKTDPSNKNPKNPIMFVDVEDAHKFAVWMGGNLPWPNQWDNAARRWAGRGNGPYQPCEEPWTGKIGVGRDEEQGPLENRQGTCDYVEILDYCKDDHRIKVYDMAGNGREWTRELMDNTVESVPLSLQRSKKPNPQDVVTIRGRSFMDRRPLRYSDLGPDAQEKDSQWYGAPDKNLGFRVVIEIPQ